MPPFIHGALVAALLLSALGAVVVCLIVVLFGFTGPEDEPPLTTARRLMYTRIGHALATTCFAATAILITMVLVRVMRPVTPAVVQDVRIPQDARIPQLGARIDAQASRVAAIETRAETANAGLTRAETRLNDVEQSLRRLTDEGRRTDHRVGRLEQAGSRTAVTERPAAVRKPSPGARTSEATPSRPSERVIAASSSSAPPSTLAPPPSTSERVAPPQSPAPASPTPATPPPTATSTTVATQDVPPLASPSSSDREPVTPVGAATESSWPAGGLRAKLQRDWEAIQKGFDSSRDDVRRAWDSTKRKLRDLVD
jgi:hypothetical protein